MRTIDAQIEFTAKEWDDLPTFIAMAILKRWKGNYDVTFAPGTESCKLREWMIGTLHLHFPSVEPSQGKVTIFEDEFRLHLVGLSTLLSADFQESLVIQATDTGERIVDRFDDWTAGQVFLAKMDVLGGMLCSSHS